MSVSDNFNRADNTDLGADWTPMINSCKIVSNGARGVNEAAENAEIWSANSWNNHHTSEITVVSGFLGPGAAVRIASGPDGYVVVSFNYVYHSNTIRIYRYDDGSLTELQSITANVDAGDTIKAEASGSTIRAYHNGSQVGTNQSDATYSGGSAGIRDDGRNWESAAPNIDSWVGTGEVVAGSVSDDFNRADSGSLGANWTDIAGGMQIVSNIARGENIGSYDFSTYTGSSWNNDQTSQATLAGSGWVDGGVIVRANDGVGGVDAYVGMALESDGSARIYRVDNGGFNLIANLGGSLAGTETIKLEVTGTTLKYFIGGVQQGSDQSDATYASGDPGIYSVGNGAVPGLDDWVGTGEVVAGNVSGPPTRTRFRRGFRRAFSR